MRAGALVLRLQLLALAAFGIGWAVIAGSQSLAKAPVVAVGREMKGGASFLGSRLEALLDSASPTTPDLDCSIAYRRGRLLIAAGLADVTMTTSNDLGAMDRARAQLDAVAREVLRCSPREGYAWLALYWTTAQREGLQGKALDFLAMSYEVAPREGWIAVRRNPQAVKAFHAMPEALRGKLAVEWSELVTAQLYEAAASSLTQSTAYRPLLFAQRDTIDERKWALLSRFLYAKGSDIMLPGAPLPPQRPWR